MTQKPLPKKKSTPTSKVVNLPMKKEKPKGKISPYTKAPAFPSKGKGKMIRGVGEIGKKTGGKKLL